MLGQAGRTPTTRRGQHTGDSARGGPAAAGHTQRLEQWGRPTVGALWECGPEIWRNRLWGLSFQAAGQGPTAGGRAASYEGHLRPSLGRVPGSAEKWAEWKRFAGGADGVWPRALQAEGGGWLRKGTQFHSGAHLPRQGNSGGEQMWQGTVGKNSRVALIPVPWGGPQRGMHPISTGRCGEAQTAHLQDRDTSRCPVASGTHLLNAKATPYLCPETNFSKKHQCLLNVCIYTSSLSPGA